MTWKRSLQRYYREEDRRARWEWFKDRTIYWVALASAAWLLILIFAGCSTCGEYRVSIGGNEVILGPGEGQCVTLKVEEPLVNALADRIRKTPPPDPAATPDPLPGDQQPAVGNGENP